MHRQKCFGPMNICPSVHSDPWGMKEQFGGKMRGLSKNNPVLCATCRLIFDILK